ncbi:MAG: hypothetical protein ABL932_26020, partial [Terricaulis sp.]
MTDSDGPLRIRIKNEHANLREGHERTAEARWRGNTNAPANTFENRSGTFRFAEKMVGATGIEPFLAAPQALKIKDACKLF